jgi:hypothetical protein
MRNHAANPTPARKPRAGVVRSLLLAVTLVLALFASGTVPASAHVLPSSSVQLDVHETDVAATVKIPLDDFQAATGIDLDDAATETVTARTQDITTYLLAHFTPTSDDGRAWNVSVNDLTVSDAGNAATTGIYRELDAALVLTPAEAGGTRSFNLGYDAVVEQVVTHVVLVTIASDWEGGTIDGGYQLGTIRLDTVSGTVPPLHVDLGDGNALNGFLSMVVLGIEHIKDGTDHQLFLLTLLTPAPLLIRRKRWAGPVTARKAVRRIGGITLAFTLGHSVTLAIGTLGVPVTSTPVEALIAVSILVAAIHAIRPLFAGKEVLVAGFFGLIHGLAFSETLRELDLTGTQLGLSLLGFNLGIEIMQLAVVALVLPALIVMARYAPYQKIRVTAAIIAAIAAMGWLASRLGIPNPIATAADSLGIVGLPVVALLWAAALMTAMRHRRQNRSHHWSRQTNTPSPPHTLATEQKPRLQH